MSTDGQGSPADITVRIGSPYETLTDERRAAAGQFAAAAREAGFSADVQAIEYVPGTRGVTPVEWTFIGVATAKALDFAYDGAKAMLRRRRGGTVASDSRRQLGFVIYGPDGSKLREWTTADGEPGAGGQPDGS